MNNRSLRALVTEYLGGECAYCKATGHLDIHHITPLYIGGRNSMGNVELACTSCHQKLHAQLIKLYPAAEQTEKLGRVAEAREEANKVEAAEALMNLVDLGVLSEDDVPNELKVLV